MRLSDLCAAMESIAPTRHAESWDNVGLLVGDPRQPVARALLTIDLTRPVFDEAVAVGCDCVIAYHPPIFEPVKRLNAGSVVFDAIHRGMAIYSPHTALDVAPDGTNDVLADALYLADRRPIRPLKPSPAGTSSSSPSCRPRTSNRCRRHSETPAPASSATTPDAASVRREPARF